MQVWILGQFATQWLNTNKAGHSLLFEFQISEFTFQNQGCQNWILTVGHGPPVVKYDI